MRSLGVTTADISNILYILEAFLIVILLTTTKNCKSFEKSPLEGMNAKRKILINTLSPEQEILIPFHAIDFSTQTQNFLPDVTLTRKLARMRRPHLFCRVYRQPTWYSITPSELARLRPSSGAVRADRSMLCPSFFSCLRLTVLCALLHKMHCYCRVQLFQQAKWLIFYSWCGVTILYAKFTCRFVSH